MQESYDMALSGVKIIREVFNTDSEQWGGSGILNRDIRVDPSGIKVQLAPLATHIFEVEFHRDDSKI